MTLIAQLMAKISMAAISYQWRESWRNGVMAMSADNGENINGSGILMA